VRRGRKWRSTAPTGCGGCRLACQHCCCRSRRRAGRSLRGGRGRHSGPPPECPWSVPRPTPRETWEPCPKGPGRAQRRCPSARRGREVGGRWSLVCVCSSFLAPHAFHGEPCETPGPVEGGSLEHPIRGERRLSAPSPGLGPPPTPLRLRLRLCLPRLPLGASAAGKGGAPPPGVPLARPWASPGALPAGRPRAARP